MDDGTILEINNCGVYCFTRPALLRLAMLLTDSSTAEVIRNELSAFAEETISSNDSDDQIDQLDSPPPAELKPNEDIQIFNNPEFGSVRTLSINGEPWFVAADVCKALEISNPTVAASRLDEDEKAKLNLGLQGSDATIINEPGLYTLVLGSQAV